MMTKHRTISLLAAIACVSLISTVAGDEPPAKKSGADEAQAYLEKLDKKLATAMEQPTTETQKTAVEKVLHDVDSEMRTKTLTFRFPILDVDRVRPKKGKPPANQKLKLDAPEGGQLSWKARDTIELKMTNADAAAVVPGDVLVFTGTPRLMVKNSVAPPEDKGNTIWILESKSGRASAIVYLQGWSHRIEHAKK